METTRNVGVVQEVDSYRYAGDADKLVRLQKRSLGSDCSYFREAFLEGLPQGEIRSHVGREARGVGSSSFDYATQRLSYQVVN